MAVSGKRRRSTVLPYQGAIRAWLVGADGRTLAAPFGDVAIDGGDHFESLGDGEDGGGTAKFLEGDLGGLGT